MDKRNKRKKSTAFNSRSKDIISFFADHSTVNRTDEYPVEKSRRFEISTIFIANIDNGKFTAPPSFVKNVSSFVFSSVLSIS